MKLLKIVLVIFLSVAFTSNAQKNNVADNGSLIPLGTKIFKNLPYVKDGHSLQKLDLYLPEISSKESLPLIVWIHGGSWKKGSKNMIERNAFVLKHGFALASINYRLVPEHIYPAQIHDCKAAIRYLRKNARSFGIDPDKIGVWGSSAGGHLAALLGTTNGVEELEGSIGITNVSSNVQAACNWFGPSDMIEMGAYNIKKLKPEVDPVVQLIGGVIQKNISKAKMASSINYVSEDDVPFLLMHGEQDSNVPCTESENLHKRLQVANVDTKLILVQDAGHGFFKEKKLHQNVVDFFEKNLINSNQVATIQNESEWIQLFNGKDLTGWIPKIRGHKLGVNYADTFRVKDGLLTVSYDKYKETDLVNLDGKGKSTFDKFGHLFYKEPLSHYILRVEYRFIGDQIKNGPEWAFRNSGIMIHGQDPSQMKKMQKFPISLEAQLLGGNGKDDRSNLNLCTPGTNVEIGGELIKKPITKSNSETFHGDQWVEVEIEVHGNDIIRYKIGGKTVIEYFKPQFDKRLPEVLPFIENNNILIDKGTISLQSESHPIQFRKIELKKLNPKNKAYRFIGNWALSMPYGSAGWLSITEKDENLKGELWMVGAPKPLSDISVENNKLYFTHNRSIGERKYKDGPASGPKIALKHSATIIGDKLNIEVEVPKNDGTFKKVKFNGVRIAPTPPKPDLSQVEYGEPIELFNGKDLNGWKLTNPNQINKWKAVDGVLFNDTPKKTFNPFAHYGNLRTEREFTDFNLDLEFNVPKGGNSGIYLRGLYEVQVVDHDSRMQGMHGVGSIFNRIIPKGNFGKAGGEWQHYNITLIDRHVTVILNGEKVIDNEPILGCTNGALHADVTKQGPIYLQGDHTKVRYRNIIIKEIIKK